MLVDICLVTAVLVINFIVTIWASTSHNGDGAIGTISEGDCSKMKKANTWIHLAINVLGTMLLSASNYCMQCLSAPTRTEVDRAHSKGVWLDIGIPSVRNLRRIGWNRVALWWLLGLSSLPLHLM